MHDSPRQDQPRVSRNARSTAPKAQLLSRTSHRPRATFPRTVTQKQQIQPKRLRVHHFIGAEFGRNQLCSDLSGPPADEGAANEHVRVQPMPRANNRDITRPETERPPRGGLSGFDVAKCSDAVWFHPLSAARTRSLSPRYGLRNSSAPGRSPRPNALIVDDGGCDFGGQRRDTQQRHCCSHPDTQCSDAYR